MAVLPSERGPPTFGHSAAANTTNLASAPSGFYMLPALATK